MRARHVIAGAAAAIALVGCGRQAAPEPTGPQRLPVVDLNIGWANVRVQLAMTPTERATGLMFRTQLAQDEGMLFAFEEPAIQCFWMKNTPLPLSAAFISDGGDVVTIAHMKSHSTEPHCSKHRVRFVLEMNQGWFESHGIKEGMRLQLLPAAKPGVADGPSNTALEQSAS